jgi:hypothetical protein
MDWSTMNKSAMVVLVTARRPQRAFPSRHALNPRPLRTPRRSGLTNRKTLRALLPTVAIAAILLLTLTQPAAAMLNLSGITGNPATSLTFEPSGPGPGATPESVPWAPILTARWKTPSAVMLDYIDVSLVETGFDLEQRRAGGTWQVIATFAPLGGTFVTGSHKVTGLEPRTEYCFRLVAFNALGDSAPNEICVLTTCAGACEEDKLVEVLEPAAYPNHEVEIDCDLYLEPQNFVFKKLVFIGSRGSGRTVDLNGATLAGGDGTQNDGKDMIEVRSEEVVERNVENDISSYARPSNTTIRNGTVYGSIRLWGMAKNGEGGEKGVIRH